MAEWAATFGASLIEANEMSATRSTAISNHNTSTTAHNNLFSALESRLAELEAWKEEIKNG